MRCPIWVVALCIGSSAGLGGSVRGGEAPAVEEHAREVVTWRQQRHESLLKPDGWFSLVGLTWLSDGDNTCGSGPQSDVRLPESAPSRLGLFRMTGEAVEIKATTGVELTVDGEKTQRANLRTDAGGAPSLVEWGTLELYLIDRGGRVGVRVKDSDSDALRAFKGIENYDIDPRWRTEARFVPYDPPKMIPVPTVLGTVNEQPSPGAVEMRIAGRDHRLDVLPGGDGEYFIVFGDATNGSETYGGGRFLYAAEADATGRVVLDFNQAHNPPCAFTPYATCPLPPRQNRLELAVRAGERKYAAGVAH